MMTENSDLMTGELVGLGLGRKKKQISGQHNGEQRLMHTPL